MRALAFLTYLSFLLLGGKGYASVGLNHNNFSYSSFQNIRENNQLKFTNEDQNITVIDDVDLDSEEEFHSDTNVKGVTENVFFVGKYSLVNTLYSTHSDHFILNYCDKRFKNFQPVIGTSCPIYIAHRVLRI